MKLRIRFEFARHFGTLVYQSTSLEVALIMLGWNYVGTMGDPFVVESFV